MEYFPCITAKKTISLEYFLFLINYKGSESVPGRLGSVLEYFGNVLWVRLGFRTQKSNSQVFCVNLFSKLRDRIDLDRRLTILRPFEPRP